mmetsp:Transcript_14093/g.44872  ORF Transcript_14093/g.44872 Transcript_14093/m.44872 type:complete len:332 (+) Transcript_14093:1408-2403(+)
MVRAGGVPALVGMMRMDGTNRDGIRVAAVRAVRSMCAHEVGRAAVMEAGGLAALIASCDDTNADALEATAATIGALAALDPEIRQEIREKGAVHALGKLLDSSEAGVVGAAAGAVKIIAADPEDKAQVAGESHSAIELLVQILEGTEPRGFEAAARGLINLAWDKVNIIAVSRAGAIGPLLRVVQSGSTKVSEGAKEAAAQCLAVLMQVPENSEAIVQEGGIVPFVAMVKFGTGTAKRQACTVLAACSAQEIYALRIAALDSIPALVAALKIPGAGMSAAMTLGHLAKSSEASRLAIAMEGAVPLLKEWMNSESQGTREAAAFALEIVGHH